MDDMLKKLLEGVSIKKKTGPENNINISNISQDTQLKKLLEGIKLPEKQISPIKINNIQQLEDTNISPISTITSTQNITPNISLEPVIKDDKYYNTLIKDFTGFDKIKNDINQQKEGIKILSFTTSDFMPLLSKEYPTYEDWLKGKEEFIKSGGYTGSLKIGNALTGLYENIAKGIYSLLPSYKSINRDIDLAIVRFGLGKKRGEELRKKLGDKNYAKYLDLLIQEKNNSIDDSVKNIGQFIGSMLGWTALMESASGFLNGIKNIGEVKKIINTIKNTKIAKKVFDTAPIITQKTIKLLKYFTEGSVAGTLKGTLDSLYKIANNEKINIKNELNNIKNETLKNGIFYSIARMPSALFKSWLARFSAGSISSFLYDIFQNKENIYERIKNKDYSFLPSLIGTSLFMGIFDIFDNATGEYKINKKYFDKVLNKTIKDIKKKTKLNENIIKTQVLKYLKSILGITEKNGNIVIDKKNIFNKRLEKILSYRINQLREKYPTFNYNQLRNIALNEIDNVLNVAKKIKDNIFNTRKTIDLNKQEILKLFNKRRNISLKKLKQEYNVNEDEIINLFNKYIKTYSPQEEKAILSKIDEIISDERYNKNIKDFFIKSKRKYNPLSVITEEYKKLPSVFDVSNLGEEVGLIRLNNLLSKNAIDKIKKFNKENKFFNIYVLDNNNLIIGFKNKLNELEFERAKNILNDFIENNLRIKNKNIVFSHGYLGLNDLIKTKENINFLVDNLKNYNETLYRKFSLLKDITLTDKLIDYDETKIINNFIEVYKKSGGDVNKYINKNITVKNILFNTLNNIKLKYDINIDKIVNMQKFSKVMSEFYNIQRSTQYNDVSKTFKQLFEELRNTTKDFTDYSNDLIKSASDMSDYTLTIWKRIVKIFNKIHSHTDDPREKTIKSLEMLIGKPFLNLNKQYVKIKNKTIQQLYFQIEQTKQSYYDILKNAFTELYKPLEKQEREFMPLILQVFYENGLNINTLNKKEFIFSLAKSMKRHKLTYRELKKYQPEFIKWLNNSDDNDVKILVDRIINIQKKQMLINEGFTEFTHFISSEFGQKFGLQLNIDYVKNTDIKLKMKDIVDVINQDENLNIKFNSRAEKEVFINELEKVVYDKNINHSKIIKFLKENDMYDLLDDTTKTIISQDLNAINEYRKARKMFFPIHTITGKERYGLKQPKVNFGMPERLQKKMTYLDALKSNGRLVIRDPLLIYPMRYSEYLYRTEVSKMFYILKDLKLDGVKVLVKNVPTKIKKFYEIKVGDILEKNGIKRSKNAYDSLFDYYIYNPFGKMFQDLAYNSVRNNVLGMLNRYFAFVKVVHFFKPFLLTRYGLEQQFISNPKSYLDLVESYKDIKNKSKTYLLADSLGVFSRSISYQDTFGNTLRNDIRDLLALTQAKDNFAGKTVDVIRKGLRGLYNSYMGSLKLLSNIAWGADEVIRLAQFKRFLKEGFTPYQSAEKVKLFALQYDRWKTTSRRIANVIFRYITYKIQTLRMYGEIAKGLVGKSDILSRKQATSSIFRVVLLKLAIQKALESAGFSWGYNWNKSWKELKKLEKTNPFEWLFNSWLDYRGFIYDKNSDRILGAVLSGPIEELPKLYMRSLSQDLILNLSDGLTIPYQLFISNRDDSFKPIIKDYSSFASVLRQVLSYAFRKIFPPAQEFKQLSEAKGLKTYQKLMSVFGLVNYIYYTDNKKELIQELKQLREKYSIEKDINAKKDILEEAKKIRNKLSLINTKIKKFKKYRNIKFKGRYSVINELLKINMKKFLDNVNNNIKIYMED